MDFFINIYVDSHILIQTYIEININIHKQVKKNTFTHTHLVTHVYIHLMFIYKCLRNTLTHVYIHAHIYTWKIIRICPSYNPNSKRCLLCLNEKYEIATYKGNNLLNKRTEIINTCRHRSKYKLANCETID